MAVSADYSFKQLEELELAYAITIHKSQGSEYPAVILPLLSGPKMLMNRNLLYTGVTRARKCVTVVGSEETFGEMIRNEKQQKRYSSLGTRIRELSEPAVSRRCPLCHRILKDSHALICPECAGDLRPIQGARCYKCGKPVSEEEEYCRDCKAAPGAFDQGRGIFLYDDRMKYSIMKYKYFGCREYSRFYGRALYLYGRDQLALWKPDVIVPVPLHWRKLRKRGFNQAELLAEELAKVREFRWMFRF